MAMPDLRTDNMQKSASSLIDNAIQSFREEFGEKAALFKPISLPMNALSGPKFESTKAAGVYVFVHDKFGYIKVGKSFSNASKRALQHCGGDNTSSPDGTIQMAQLDWNDKTHLLIFALQNEDSKHWILALEYYLEVTLEPKIPSKRNG